jgi:membrane protein implicated in regulation of membrane protease activity
MIEDALFQTADVYTKDAGTGKWTVQSRTGLQCRLATQQYLTNQHGSGTPDRSRGLPGRRLIWVEEYELPQSAQVEVDGQRWNVVQGSEMRAEDKHGEVYYRGADVLRAAQS